MTEPLRETLAMAIYAHLNDPDDPWEKDVDWDQDTYRGVADAVLGALSDWAWEQEDAGDALRYLMGKT